MGEIYEGLVEGEVQLCAGNIVIDGRTHQIRPEQLSFDLRDANGETIRVRVDSSTECGPHESTRAPWSEFEQSGHPLLRGFEHAPGGHIKATLESVVVNEGDHVFIAGDVELGHASDGYRGGKEPKIKSVQAEWLGVGDDGREWVELRVVAVAEAEAKQAEEQAEEQVRAEHQREKERARQARERVVGTELPIDSAKVLGLTAVLGIAFGAIAREAQPQYAPVGLAYGFLCASLALFIWRRRRFTPRMREATSASPPNMSDLRGPRHSFRLLWGIGGPGVPVFILAAILMLIPSFVLLFEHDTSDLIPFLFGIPALTILVQGAVIFWENRATARALRLIGRAAPASGEGWGLRVGTITEGSVNRTRTHTRESSTSTENYTDSNGNVQSRQVTRNWIHGIESGGFGTLHVQLGDVEAQVELGKSSVWGTSHRIIRKLRLTEKIEEGDHVVVLSRLKDRTIKPKGPESLFVFASRGADPLGVLRRSLLLHRLGMLGFVLLLAGSIAVVVLSLRG